MINVTFLKEEPFCKFILKDNIKNYFWQFTKTLSICFQWNTTVLVICNYVWLEQLNVCAKSGVQELEILVHDFRAPNNMLAYTIVHLTFRVLE